MPTFVTEGLIFGKPSIVSEHTGTAGLITEGVDGFVYKDDDPQQLADLLEHAIEHPEELAAMQTAAVKCTSSIIPRRLLTDAPGCCGRSDSGKSNTKPLRHCFAMPLLLIGATATTAASGG